MNLKIVMYHYIRDIKYSRYPGIKGLELNDFRKQLEYLAKDHTFVGLRDCVEGLTRGLPSNPCLLTFDDGYLDHYTNVFPILMRMGIPGAFFPPGRAIMERKVLDVNKIHFILASCDARVLFKELSVRLGMRRFMEYGDCHQPTRYDNADTAFVKKLLQSVLPVHERKALIDEWFNQVCAGNETAFANELYMSSDQIRYMYDAGMDFGSHGWDHAGLVYRDEEFQGAELDGGLRFLQAHGISTKNWTMCYPYGGVDELTVKLAKDRGCALGLTTVPEVATLDHEHALRLSRLDCNDISRPTATASVQ